MKALATSTVISFLKNREYCANIKLWEDGSIIDIWFSRYYGSQFLVIRLQRPRISIKDVRLNMQQDRLIMCYPNVHIDSYYYWPRTRKELYTMWNQIVRIYNTLADFNLKPVTIPERKPKTCRRKPVK